MGAKYDDKLAAALEKARLVYEEKKRRIYAKFQSDFAKKYASINPIQQAASAEAEAETVEETTTNPLEGTALIVGTYENHDDQLQEEYE